MRTVKTGMYVRSFVRVESNYFLRRGYEGGSRATGPWCFEVPDFSPYTSNYKLYYTFGPKSIRLPIFEINSLTFSVFLILGVITFRRQFGDPWNAVISGARAAKNTFF